MDRAASEPQIPSTRHPSVFATVPSPYQRENPLSSPFDLVLPSEDTASQASFAESHHANRGWISECLVWLSSWRKQKYESDYTVLFVNGSERFGSNSCRLSGKDSIIRCLVMSEGVSTPFAPSDANSTHGSNFEPMRVPRQNLCERVRRAFSVCFGHPRVDSIQSDYTVLLLDGENLVGSNLLPLSGTRLCFLNLMDCSIDPRLRPRLPKLLILILILLSVGGISCVFFLVPRGVSIGEPLITSEDFSINYTTQSVALCLEVHLPIKNPNYVSVDITGEISMKYYDQAVGFWNTTDSVAKLHTANVIPHQLDECNVWSRLLPR